MNFYWVLFSASALGAWLIGYGMGYIRAAKDAANSRNGKLGFSGNQSDGEISASTPEVNPRSASEHECFRSARHQAL